MRKLIKQEKTNEYLEKKANGIIELLEDLNIAEKYKVIKSLLDSLFNIIRDEGIVIEINKQ